MRSLQFRRVSFLLTTLLVLAAPSLWAQPRGSIRAGVLDPLGARISGATIKLLRAGTVIRAARRTSAAPVCSTRLTKAGISSK